MLMSLVINNHLNQLELLIKHYKLLELNVNVIEVNFYLNFDSDTTIIYYILNLDPIKYCIKEHLDIILVKLITFIFIYIFVLLYLKLMYVEL